MTLAVNTTVYKLWFNFNAVAVVTASTVESILPNGDYLMRTLGTGVPSFSIWPKESTKLVFNSRKEAYQEAIKYYLELARVAQELADEAI